MHRLYGFLSPYLKLKVLFCSWMLWSEWFPWGLLMKWAVVLIDQWVNLSFWFDDIVCVIASWWESLIRGGAGRSRDTNVVHFCCYQFNVTWSPSLIGATFTLWSNWSILLVCRALSARRHGNATFALLQWFFSETGKIEFGLTVGDFWLALHVYMHDASPSSSSSLPASSINTDDDVTYVKCTFLYIKHLQWDLKLWIKVFKCREICVFNHFTESGVFFPLTTDHVINLYVSHHLKYWRVAYMETSVSSLLRNKGGSLIKYFSFNGKPQHSDV